MRARPLLVLLAVAACASPASERLALPEVPGVIARFAAARALAADPSGTLYVVDAGESVIVVLGRTGVVGAVLGGPGTGRGAFLDPTDVDPTNGQSLFIADAGAGTISHVTAAGRTAETVAVPEVDPSRWARAVGADLRALPRGRPLAVAAAPDGALYVVEAGRGVVLRLDDQRGVDRVLGGPAAGPAALAEPVDVAVGSNGAVYVADRGRGIVQMFDAFGAPGRAIPVSDVGGLVAVEAVGDGLVVTGSRGVAVYRLAGGREALWPVDVGEPLVGAAVTPAGRYVLTPTRLFDLDLVLTP